MSRTQHLFSQVPHADIQRSSFNRSHNYKSTFDFDYLIPFYIDEVLPGDTFNLKASILARLSTPMVPVMDDLYLDTFFFFVPYRLIWDKFVNFMGEEKEPGDYLKYNPGGTTPMTTPKLDIVTIGSNSLGDYMGLPVGKSLKGTADGRGVCVFPFRAYNLIWNEWFRDENLQDKVAQNVDNGPDAPWNYAILKRGKRHDYFTSCLPFVQKGPMVGIPMGADVPVVLNPHEKVNVSVKVDRYNNLPTLESVPNDWGLIPSDNPNKYYPYWFNLRRDPANNEQLPGPPPGPMYVDPSDIASSGLYVSLGNVQAITINSLRYAFQLQRLYERDARGGTRYTELIRSHFGVVSPDARLQRPEYLGGSSARINISPVAQTAATSGTTTPQGNLAAFGVVADNVNGFKQSFTEHGLVMGLVCVRSALNYSQGMHRMWSRDTRFDFYWPALAHLGEDAVFNREIYYQGNSDDAQVFGYQERWADYRYYPGQITGLFRPDVTGNLAYWHTSELFSTKPSLNSTFIQSNTPKRFLALSSQPAVLMDSWIDLQCVRPMPVYSVPGLIDHF